jgi:integrase/recombinase XerD
VSERPPDALDHLLVEHDTWLAVERGVAANTLLAYRRDLDRYAAFLRRRGVTDPRSVGEDAVVAYVEHLKSARDEDGRPRFAPSSIARALVSVRSFHRFCVEEGFLSVDPSEEVGAPRVPQGIPKALTEEEVGSLLAAVAGDGPRALRDRAILETLYAAGVRISELVGLDRPDLDLADGLLRVLGKGSKERVVPVGRSSRAALGAYLERGRPSLVSRRSRTASDPERARWAPHPPGCLVGRALGGRAGRARRAPLAPRPPALLRHSHARPRGRHPRGPGAARPRQPLDHPGVYQGFARTAPGRLRRRPSPGAHRGRASRACRPVTWQSSGADPGCGR